MVWPFIKDVCLSLKYVSAQFAGALAASTISGTRPVQRPAEFGNLTHNARAEVRILFRRHHEDGFHARFHLAIHERHLQLEFVVADGADAAQHGVGVLLDAVAHQQALEGIDGNVVEVRGHGHQHLFALRQREERLALVEIARNGHDQFIEEFGSPVDQVQMAVGDGIERSGIDGDDVLQGPSETGIYAMILFWQRFGRQSGMQLKRWSAGSVLWKSGSQFRTGRQPTEFGSEAAQESAAEPSRRRLKSHRRSCQGTASAVPQAARSNLAL